MDKNEYTNDMTLSEILGLKNLIKSNFSKNIIGTIDKKDLKINNKKKINKKKIFSFIIIILFFLLFIFTIINIILLLLKK